MKHVFKELEDCYPWGGDTNLLSIVTISPVLSAVLIGCFYFFIMLYGLYIVAVRYLGLPYTSLRSLGVSPPGSTVFLIDMHVKVQYLLLFYLNLYCSILSFNHYHLILM